MTAILDFNSELKAKLLGSFLLFTQTFYKIITGREFVISNPIGRESHFITIARHLTKVFKLDIKNLLTNMPPGWGKSELCKYFVAWCFAHYPDCQFLYVSKDHDLASYHTGGIKDIMSLPQYKKLFLISISKDSNAKDFFKTSDGGVVAAFGSAGGITGFNAGLPHLMRFSGAIIIDDLHKPDEIHSDVRRAHIIRNYFETLLPRRRGINVPVIFIGQRLHEDDMCQHIIDGEDGLEWDKLIIKALDEHDNPGYPEVHNLVQLRIWQEKNRYVFSSQFQQDPLPAGGGLFLKEDFQVLIKTPAMLKTFITVDTAETQEKYNDATVFSFWGIYKIEDFGIETDLYGLHWIDCIEIRVEPRDLEINFSSFYAECLRFDCRPDEVYIEKKSTGVTLISVLQALRGIKIREVERSRGSGSKSDRFIAMQSFISNKLISITQNSNHLQMCLEHMSKITANNTHRHDDIADTLYDAIKLVYIDKNMNFKAESKPKVRLNNTKSLNNLVNLREKAYATRQ